MGNKLACGLHGETEESTPERQTLEKVCKWFKKYEKATDNHYIQIPQTEFEECYRYIKDTLESTKEKAGFDQKNSDNRTEDMNSQLLSVQILNDRSTTPATLFVKQLQYALQKEHHIGATVIEKLNELKPEERQVLVTICNRNESGPITTAVEKCLKNIDRSFYKRIILIVLHVARQEALPKMPSRGELQSNKIYSEIGRVIDMGFESGMLYSCKMNDNAFKEIANFCSEYGSTSNNTVIQSDGTNCSVVKRQLDLQDSHIRKGINESTRRPAYIYIIDPSNANAVTRFIEAFNEKLKKTGIVLKQKEIHDVRDIDQDQCLILLCNASSRIESDIEGCLSSNIQDAIYIKTIILIVLHVVRKDREPKEYTRKKLENSNCSEKLSSFHSVIDMAFTEDDGIYECPMNEKAFVDLESIFVDLPATEIKAEDGAMSLNNEDSMDNYVGQPHESEMLNQPLLDNNKHDD
ncbi:uncharacterized protein LOC123542711 [Mercenaria mercenaria]|uniref:uncharacterized protein LOC123542711 n=1 Tax=Mercenaria mercenaria TaxID=6596 RepID=UPI00234F442E|nr:uncharacterized protein LOC123542711 [Mercenaria mercenaria]